MMILLVLHIIYDRDDGDVTLLFSCLNIYMLECILEGIGSGQETRRELATFQTDQNVTVLVLVLEQ